MKDGEWHDFQQGQVFLCKACEKQPLVPPRKTSK